MVFLWSAWNGHNYQHDAVTVDMNKTLYIVYWNHLRKISLKPFEYPISQQIAGKMKLFFNIVIMLFYVEKKYIQNSHSLGHTTFIILYTTHTILMNEKNIIKKYYKINMKMKQTSNNKKIKNGKSIAYHHFVCYMYVYVIYFWYSSIYQTLVL